MLPSPITSTAFHTEQSSATRPGIGCHSYGDKPALGWGASLKVLVALEGAAAAVSVCSGMAPPLLSHCEAPLYPRLASASTREAFSQSFCPLLTCLTDPRVVGIGLPWWSWPPGSNAPQIQRSNWPSLGTIFLSSKFQNPSTGSLYFCCLRWGPPMGFLMTSPPLRQAVLTLMRGTTGHK